MLNESLTQVRDILSIRLYFCSVFHNLLLRSYSWKRPQSKKLVRSILRMQRNTHLNVSLWGPQCTRTYQYCKKDGRNKLLHFRLHFFTNQCKYQPKVKNYFRIISTYPRTSFLFSTIYCLIFWFFYSETSFFVPQGLGCQADTALRVK